MSVASPPALILASASPRRRALLAQIGVAHRVEPAHVDECRLGREGPEDYVLRLARFKAEQVWARNAGAAALPVLGADTAVVLDGEIYGKPADEAEGVRMLSALSGRTHRVLSAVALISAAGIIQRLSASDVSFRALSAAECRAYWASGEPRDKAGGYAIQGLGAVFVERLLGSYSGVMGLPLFETAALLRAAGLAAGAPGVANEP